MRTLILTIMLSLGILNAVGFEDRQAMLDCYLTKPEVLQRGHTAYYQVVEFGLKENNDWDSFVTLILALDEFHLAIFKHCPMPLRKSLAQSYDNGTNTMDMLMELAYIYLTAEQIRLDKGGQTR